MTFLLLLGDSSLVHLFPSSPSIQVLAVGQFCLAPTPFCVSVFAVPSEGSKGSSEALTAAKAAAQHAPLPTSSLQRANSDEVTDPTTSAPSSPGNTALLMFLPRSDRTSTQTHWRTVAATGTAPLAVDYGTGLGPLDHPPGVLSPRHGSHGRARDRPSVWPLFLPPRPSRRNLSCPTAIAPSLWGLFV